MSNELLKVVYKVLPQWNTLMVANVYDGYINYSFYHFDNMDETKTYSEENLPDIMKSYLVEDNLIISGVVKWDGCSNWKFPGAMYYHSCDREGLIRIGEMMAYAWDCNIALCPGWIGSD